MSMKLKALGVAFLASLAVGAISVVSATGNTGGHFTSDAAGAWTVIDGDQEGGSAANFLEDTESGVNITCPDNKVTYDASIGAATVTSVTVKPTYPTTGGECSVIGGFGGVADIHTEDCHFVLTVETTDPKAQIKHTAAHLVCPAGKEITVTADPTLVGTCVIHIPTQTPTSGGVVYTGVTHSGKAALTLDITANGITNNKTPSGFLGCGGSSGENNASNLVGKVTVTAKATDGITVPNVRATGP